SGLLLLDGFRDDRRHAYEAYRPGEGVGPDHALDVVAVHEWERVEAEHRVGAAHVNLPGARLLDQVRSLHDGVAGADDGVDDYRVPPLHVDALAALDLDLDL